ncbi:type II toxin-antitoxin system PemK/MazF family toxin [Candidatus Micrarchaeota archaeon]|nr:type II toxin-antitoxin system PemK/MazF family toxin [Candidatus Micrarchaeota archaeon]
MDVSFIDSSGSKVRPALIISGKRYNNSHPDVIICSITSNSSHDCFLEIGKMDLTLGSVCPGSGVRHDTIRRVAKTELIRRVAKVSREYGDGVVRGISSILG